MKRITRIACAVLAAVVVAGCTYRIDESNIVIARSAPPVDLSVLHAEFPGYRIEPAAITTPDGNRLQSLRFVREDAVATVLYFGGNGYTVARFAPRTLAVYRDREDLVSIGAYAVGSDPKVDYAIAKKPDIDRFLQQTMDERSTAPDARAQLELLMGDAPHVF